MIGERDVRDGDDAHARERLEHAARSRETSFSTNGTPLRERNSFAMVQYGQVGVVKTVIFG